MNEIKQLDLYLSLIMSSDLNYLDKHKSVYNSDTDAISRIKAQLEMIGESIQRKEEKFGITKKCSTCESVENAEEEEGQANGRESKNDDDDDEEEGGVEIADIDLEIESDRDE